MTMDQAYFKVFFFFFTNIDLFNSHDILMRKALLLLTYFTDKENEAQRG